MPFHGCQSTGTAIVLLLQAFEEKNQYVYFHGCQSIKTALVLLLYALAEKTWNVSLSLLLVYKNSNCAIAISFSRKNLECVSFIAVSL